MRNLPRMILWMCLVLLACAHVEAQRRTPPNRRPAPASTEEARARYVGLIAMRDGLRTYLDSLRPDTPDYEAAAQSLRETEEQIDALVNRMFGLRPSETPASPPPIPAAPRAPRLPVTPFTVDPTLLPPAGSQNGGEPQAGEDEQGGPADRAQSGPEEGDRPEDAPQEGPQDGGDPATPPPGLVAPAPQADPPLEVEGEGAGAGSDNKASLNFMEWLNDKVEEKSVALINQGSNANQTETPATSGASTSLVDQSSASDLIGVAFNLAGLSGATGDDKDVNSASITTSAYALYAAFKGADPLEPEFYNQHKEWRKLSLTLGFDNEKEEGEETADKVTLAGFKYLIHNGRDASDAGNDRESCRVSRFVLNSMVNRVGPEVARTRAADDACASGREAERRYLSNAASAFAEIEEEIITFLVGLPTVRQRIAGVFDEFMDGEIASLEADNRADLIRIAPLRQRHGNKTRAQLTAEAETLRQEIATLRARIETLESARAPVDPALRRELGDKRDLRRDLGVLLATEVRNRQIEEYRKGKALPKETLLDPARRPQWTWAERRYFNVGFKRTILQRGDNFQGLVGDLTAEERDAVDQLIDDRINPFVELNRSTRLALERIRARPQLSFSFLSKRRDRGDDEYTSDLIYERGLGTRTFATLNAGFKYKNSPLVGGDSRGGRVAGQLQFQVTPEQSLISRSPIYLYVSGDAEWLSGVKPKYRAQAKVKIPLADGIEIPFSVTVANRTDLIDETDVRGQFGFTFDTARILRAFKFRLPSLGGRGLDLSTIIPRLPATPAEDPVKP